MKNLFLLIIVSIASYGFAFSQDTIVKKNGERINCKIFTVDSLKVYFTVKVSKNNTSTFYNKNETRYIAYNREPASLMLKNGKEVDCVIIKEDSLYVYTNANTSYKKSNIQTIKYNYESVASKIDSLYNWQKKIVVESKPISNKNFGIEFNFFRLLDENQDNFFSLSGTLSLFNVNRNAEIAFPIYYGKTNNGSTISDFTLDCHYRYFLGSAQNGFYMSCFARFANLSGTVTNYQMGYPSNTTTSPKSADKLGIGVGIGYRKFSKNGLYWGASLSVGRFIIGENNILSNNNDGNYGLLGNISGTDDSEIIFDIEFFKFGWAF